MSEYIKKEDAREAIREVCRNLNYLTSPVSQLTTAIDKMPTVDVAEIVRCKDCKYRIGGNCYISNFIAGLPCMIRYVAENDYCSDGEPKEQENE